MNKVIFLVLGMFALGLDAYIISGILPSISQTFDVSFAEVAQAVTAFTLSYAIVAPIAAAFFDGKSSRKVLFFTMALFSLANLGSAFSINLNMLLVTRVFAGLAAGLYFPITVSIASKLVSAKRKGTILGFILGGMSAGTVIGVPIGLVIADYIGWQSVFIMITCIGCISMIGILMMLPDISMISPPSLKQRMTVISDKKVAFIVGISFLTAVASLGLYTYVSPILTSLNSKINLTPYFWCWGIGGVVGSFTIGLLIDKTGKPSYLLAGILCLLMITLFAIPTVTHSSLISFLPFALWGAMGWSSLAPQQHTLLSIKPEHGATVVALNGSSNYFGSAVGAILGSLLIAYGISPVNLPYWAGGVAMLALLGQILILTYDASKYKAIEYCQKS